MSFRTSVKPSRAGSTGRAGAALAQGASTYTWTVSFFLVGRSWRGAMPPDANVFLRPSSAN